MAGKSNRARKSASPLSRKDGVEGGAPGKSRGFDQLSPLEIATVMNREDAGVARAVRRALPAVAQAIDLIADRLSRGGRLIYVGSGTSGRIGALDAAECPPTFGTEPHMVQAIIAGGEAALAKASEGSEDSSELGAADMAQRRPGKKDVVAAVSASGQTPYTIAALRTARKKGAATLAIVCRKGTELARICELAIEIDTGAEVVSGSTRLKAGTAQKMICNMLTTGAMSRLGYVYAGQMVRLQMTNAKLVERGIDIVERLAGVERAAAEAALRLAQGKVPLAVLMLRANLGRRQAERELKSAGGNLRKALADEQLECDRSKSSTRKKRPTEGAPS